uniref:F-box/WD repeat-containing protein 9 n=2 Tax=Cacopsylla melanoneura TaxID=428564 RepID=A0A8D9B7J5_9HEMI
MFIFISKIEKCKCKQKKFPFQKFQKKKDFEYSSLIGPFHLKIALFSLKMGSDDEDKVTLDTLPNEIFLYICTYLDSYFILNVLKKVCTRFDNILSDDYVWRKKTSIDYPNTTILFPETDSEPDNNSNKPWTAMVYEVETNRKFFQDAKATENSETDAKKVMENSEMQTDDKKDPESNGMQKIVFKDLHISTINALKLVCDNRLCISVSRDRSIGVWNVADSATQAVRQVYPAHDGWVWCIDSCIGTDTFCTGAWDSTLKIWSLEDFTNISTYKYQGTVLSVSCTESLVAAGLFNAKLIVQDTRVPPCDGIQWYLVEHTFEKKGVIQGVTIDGQNVYVASANGIISCYDMRKKDVVNSTAPLCNKKDNIMSYSYRNGNIVMGDTGNTLTILNRNLEVLAQRTIEFENPLQRKLSCIKQNDYDIFVGSKGSLHSFIKSDPITAVERLQSCNYEMTAIEYEFDQILLHSSNLDGEIVMLKRPQNTITV